MIIEDHADSRPVSLHASFACGRMEIPALSDHVDDRPAGIDAWVLILTLRGCGLVSCDGEESLLERGRALLIPPYTAHRYVHAQERRWVHLWFYFQPKEDWTGLLDWSGRCGQLRLADPAAESPDRLEMDLERLERAGLEVLEQEGEGSPLGDAFSLNRLEYLLLTIRSLAGDEAVSGLDERVARALSLIRENPVDPALTVPFLAGRVYLSESRFAHLFKDQTGISPGAAIEKGRIRHASRLLLFTGMSIGMISDQCCFSDSGYFSRCFKKVTGFTPLQYRQLENPPPVQ